MVRPKKYDQTWFGLKNTTDDGSVTKYLTYSSVNFTKRIVGSKITTEDSSVKIFHTIVRKKF